MSRRLIAAASALLVATLGIAACSGSSGGGGGGGGSSSGELLRVGTLNKFEQTNPFNAFDFTDYFVQQMEYPYLIQYNSAGQIIPDFATSWTTSSDGKTWTFHLVPNAKWSDGKPMTSADVAFTLNTIIKYQTGATALDEAYVSGHEGRHDPERDAPWCCTTPARWPPCCRTWTRSRSCPSTSGRSTRAATAPA